MGEDLMISKSRFVRLDWVIENTGQTGQRPLWSLTVMVKQQFLETRVIQSS
uniref:Uncharacterized protein n=1 Tax=Octopus bimaculoides TaxID=37653 RepID=A0A0L8HDY2_OCTBM